MSDSLGYIHLLLDRDPAGPNGQEICEGCKLELPESLEGWENFLNGAFTPKQPNAEGFYPVLLSGSRKDWHSEALSTVGALGFTQSVLYARPALRRKGVIIWADAKLGAKVAFRWSLPLPQMPSMAPLAERK
jgi:hypothetical protein